MPSPPPNGSAASTRSWAASTFSWAASISDDNQRLNELRQTLKSWRGSDLNAARAAFDNADLTSKERESLAKELE